MTEIALLQCDGCGQFVGSSHLARRLVRLEQATRYRPVHIQALILGTVSPVKDEEYLYSEKGEFAGEAAAILKAAGIGYEGKARGEVLAEFQKKGLMLAYVLECPVEAEAGGKSREELVGKHLGATLARIRRSLKPKRVVVLAGELGTPGDRIDEGALGVPVEKVDWEGLGATVAGKAGS